MKKANMQDVFLNNIRKEKIIVTIFLSNGIKLQGKIIGFDNFTIALKRENQIQLIYKHTIATILPSSYINLIEEE